MVNSAIHRAEGGVEKPAPGCHSSTNRLLAPSISPRALVPSSGPGPQSRLWYKDFLQLIGYGDTQRVEEYCERVWCASKKQKKNKRRYAPLGGGKGKGRADENSHRAPRHTLDT